MRVRALTSSAGRTRGIAGAWAVFESVWFVAFRRRRRAGMGRAAGSEEREGKIKGAARAGPECVSARGFGAARHPAVPVLRANVTLRDISSRGEPPSGSHPAFH